MNRFPSVVAALALASCVWDVPARAEVSAETDFQGNYLRTAVFYNASVRNAKIWSVQREKAGFHPLNRTGDDNGDLWPLVADQTVGEFQPWVIWSRFNGADYDLAWANFRSGAWSPVVWIEPAPSAPGDDLDPDLAFDANGRPYLVWWRNENGTGRVYLSVFLSTRWMTAFPVSEPGVDSVFPDVTVLPDGKIEVAYDTPEGRMVRIVTFARPSTITDDVTPWGSMAAGPPTAADSLSN